MSGMPVKKPDMDGFRSAMKSAEPGKKFQNARLLAEALEIVVEARSRGVPWVTIEEGLTTFGMSISVAYVKKKLSVKHQSASQEGEEAPSDALPTGADQGVEGDEHE